VLAVLGFNGGAGSGFAAGCDQAQGRLEHSVSSERSPGAQPKCPDPATHSRTPCAAVSLCGAASCIPAMGHTVQQLAGLPSDNFNDLPPDGRRLAEWKLPPPVEPPRLFG
jgi:hypothetical protein